MINTKISLNETEQDVCKKIAKTRYSVNRKSKIKNSKIGNQTDELTDLEGVAAEFAFCKIFNIYPTGSLDTSLRSTSKDQDAGDAIVHNKRIDVKTTSYPNGRLLAAPWKKVDNIDCFALMVGTFPTYIFKGFMSSKELLSNKRLGNLGHGTGYIAEQKDLVELEKLS